jgi:hypothetical protein
MERKLQNKFWSENIKERDGLEDSEVDRMTILKQKLGVINKEVNKELNQENTALESVASWVVILVTYALFTLSNSLCLSFITCFKAVLISLRLT